MFFGGEVIYTLCGFKAKDLFFVCFRKQAESEG